MDPASNIILKHRLQAVVFRRDLLENFSKIFRLTDEVSNVPEQKASEPTIENEESGFGTDCQEACSERELDPLLLPTSEEAQESTGAEANPDQEQLGQPDGSPKLSPEDEQECREDTYVRFSAEDTIEDYTVGPSRLVAGFDGVRTCAALLLTYDFSQKVKKAIKLQRHCDREQRHAEEQLEIIDRFRREVRGEISNHELRIMAAEEGDDESPELERDAQIAAWKSAIEVLQKISSDMECRKTSLETNLEWKAEVLREAQSAVTTYLDEAFTEAVLMEPDNEEEKAIEEFDLQEEYQKKLQDTEEELERETPLVIFPNAPQQLDTTPEYLAKGMKPPTEEELEAERIRTTVWDARDRVHNAQGTFDNKAYQQEYEQEVAYQAELAGEPTGYESLDDFDLQWLKRNQELTRELIEAEEAYSQAKAAAIEAGVRFEMDDQSSCFGEDFDCTGYPMSQEIDVEGAAAYAMPKVDKWLDDVPEDADSDYEGSVDVDEWDFNELDVCDSLSCVAYGKGRKRIDKWQRDCHVDQE